MRIAHLQKTSLIDYPGKISAVVFTQGCNLRCPYCHNPELVEPGLFSNTVEESKVTAFLERRKGKLDGIVITGGEPAIQKGLSDFMLQVKDMGFLVKLDTNGTLTDVLEKIIERHLADYIAMDIKAPAGKYNEIAGTPVNMDSIFKSIQLIIGSGIDYEFRTTWAAEQLSVADIVEIATMIKGAKRFALQRFNPSKHLDPAMLNSHPPIEAAIIKAVEASRNLVRECVVR
jgi:pyruvate formate lyase activating enzyme